MKTFVIEKHNEKLLVPSQNAMRNRTKYFQLLYGNKLRKSMAVRRDFTDIVRIKIECHFQKQFEAFKVFQIFVCMSRYL